VCCVCAQLSGRFEPLQTREDRCWCTTARTGNERSARSVRHGYTCAMRILPALRVAVAITGALLVVVAFVSHGSTTVKETEAVLMSTSSPRDHVAAVVTDRERVASGQPASPRTLVGRGGRARAEQGGLPSAETNRHVNSDGATKSAPPTEHMGDMRAGSERRQKDTSTPGSPPPPSPLPRKLPPGHGTLLLLPQTDESSPACLDGSP
jgi:hypothetical protein